jgi:hypothetical protein
MTKLCCRQDYSAAIGRRVRNRYVVTTHNPRAVVAKIFRRVTGRWVISTRAGYNHAHYKTIRKMADILNRIQEMKHV